MKINPTLTIIAVTYLLINFLFYLHAITLNGGASMVYVFIYPAFWIITLILIIVLCIKNRKLWFKRNLIFSTLISLFFCTPVSVSLIVLLVRPASYCYSTAYTPTAEYTLKTEEWGYYTGGRAAVKYWKGDNKDSTWVYFNKKGDTIKTETYKADTLIRTKEYK